MGLWNLTKAEARKVANVLRVEGHKMPKVGYCVALGGGEEVCRDAKGYYLLTKDHTGDFDKAIRQERGASEGKRESNPGRQHLPGATAKQNRQYEHIYQSEKAAGRSTARAKQIAAATVNKERGKKKRRSAREGARWATLPVGSYFRIVGDPDDALLKKISPTKWKVIESPDKFAVGLSFSARDFIAGTQLVAVSDKS